MIADFISLDRSVVDIAWLLYCSLLGLCWGFCPSTFLSLVEGQEGWSEEGFWTLLATLQVAVVGKRRRGIDVSRFNWSCLLLDQKKGDGQKFQDVGL